jgi:acetylornithine deacetylase
LWLQIETRGKAAHGATPELGRNAVHEMAQVVHLLETDYARALKRRSHPLLGHATISVNQIAGGVQPNTVADHCVAFADRRTLPGETESTVRREILQLLGKHNLKATVFDSKPAPCLPLETDPRLPLVRRLMECAGQMQPAGVQFFCDASVLAHGGIPSVVFGPGDVAQAHGKNEWVSVKSVERATACLVRFLQSLS